MTTFNAATYAVAYSVAGTITRDSSRDGGYRLWLLAQQGYKCWDCGTNVPVIAEGIGEYTHIHRAAKGGVYFAGLGAIGCRECNLDHNEISDGNGSIPLAYIMSNGRYLNIPMDLPTRAECVRIFKADRAASAAAKADRIARKRSEAGLA